jgi:hypothetical protein
LLRCSLVAAAALICVVWPQSVALCSCAGHVESDGASCCTSEETTCPDCEDVPAPDRTVLVGGADVAPPAVSSTWHSVGSAADWLKFRRRDVAGHGCRRDLLEGVALLV